MPYWRRQGREDRFVVRPYFLPFRENTAVPCILIPRPYVGSLGMRLAVPCAEQGTCSRSLVPRPRLFSTASTVMVEPGGGCSVVLVVSPLVSLVRRINTLQVVYLVWLFLRITTTCNLYIIWLVRQRFLELVAHAQTVDTRPFSLFHVAWVWG